MKMNTTYTAIALSLGLVAASNAAITFTLDNAGTGGGGSGVLNGSGGWNFKQAGSWANVYWDANDNGTFGEAGENSGNTTALLSNVIGGLEITDGMTMNFAVEGFDGAGGTSSSYNFGITKTDTNLETINVLTGSTVNFFDGAQEWEVAYDFTAQGYGDVVFNIGTGAGGQTQDHKAVLTFTAVPEPSSAALLGLGGLALILRRRK